MKQRSGDMQEMHGVAAAAQEMLALETAVALVCEWAFAVAVAWGEQRAREGQSRSRSPTLAQPAHESRLGPGPAATSSTSPKRSWHSGTLERCAAVRAYRGLATWRRTLFCRLSRVSQSDRMVQYVLDAFDSGRAGKRTHPRRCGATNVYTRRALRRHAHCRGAPETVSLIECQSAEYDLSSTHHSRQPIISSFTWVVSHARTSQRSGFLQSPVLPSAAVRIGRLAWTLEFSSPAPSSLPAALSLTCR